MASFRFQVSVLNLQIVNLVLPAKAVSFSELVSQLRDNYFETILEWNPEFAFQVILNDNGQWIQLDEESFEVLKEKIFSNEVFLSWRASFGVIQELVKDKKSVFEPIGLSCVYDSIKGFKALDKLTSDFNRGKTKSTDSRHYILSLSTTNAEHFSTYVGSDEEILQKGYSHILFARTLGYSSLTLKNVVGRITGLPEHLKSITDLPLVGALEETVTDFMTNRTSEKYLKLNQKVTDVVPTIEVYLKMFQATLFQGDAAYSEANRRMIINIFTLSVSYLLGLSHLPELEFQCTESRVGNGPLDYSLSGDCDCVVDLGIRMKDSEASEDDDSDVDDKDLRSLFVEGICEAKAAQSELVRGIDDKCALAQLVGQMIDKLSTGMKVGDKRGLSGDTKRGPTMEVKGILTTGHHNYFFLLERSSDKPRLSYCGHCGIDILPKATGRMFGCDPNGLSVDKKQIEGLLMSYYFFMGGK